MSETEIQDEEREVLLSIYDGDESFKQISKDTFQYKYGENDSMKSFVLEIKWNEKYPNELPQINMETFYNRHIEKQLKEKIINLTLDEAKNLLGMSMTYTLFEFIKEKFDELMIEQQLELNNDNSLFIENVDKLKLNDNKDNIKSVPKKEQLTKAQKRRQWNRMDNNKGQSRGWNWVDIIKHLSQTGPKENSSSSSSSSSNAMTTNS